MQSRRLLAVGAFGLLAAPAIAQRTRTDLGYGEISIIRCRPERGPDCEAFYTGAFHGAAQALVNKRLASGYVVTKILFPPPSEVGYTHLLEVQSEQPLPAEYTPEFIQTRDEALGRPDAATLFEQLRELISRIRVATTEVAGRAPSVGDFVRIDFIKTTPQTRADLADWMRARRQPMMERLIQEGRIRGWNFRPLQLRGFEEEFDAIETTIFKDADTVMGGGEPIDFRAVFQKVFPHIPLKTYEEESRTLRYVARTRVGRIIDLVGPAASQ